MKKNLLKKLFALCAFGLVGFAAASCQHTNINEAKVVIVKESTANIYVDEGDGKRYATATIGVENNTIYNVITWDIKYDLTYLDGKVEHCSSETTMGVRHGAAGYVTFLEELKDDLTNPVVGAKIVSGTPKQHWNIWQTYLGWWIAGFAVLLCSIIFFAFKLFDGALSKEEAKQIFKEHVASSLFGSLLVLIVVLFPLILGSWVPTVILAGGLVGSLLVNGLLTWIKALTNK